MRAGGHPSLEDLALFAENAPGAGVREIEEHLAHCEECSTAVLMHCEAQSAEEIGLSPEGRMATNTASVPPKPKSRPNPFAGLFSGILANVAIGEGLTHLRHQPGLAGSHDHAPEPAPGDPHASDVRNAASHASDYLHGRHEADTPSMERNSGASMHDPHVFHKASENIGLHPTNDVSEYVHQEYQDTCAIQCQHLILNQFGVPATETQLVREAIADGIYSPGHGTNPADVGKLLEDHGLAVHRYFGANVFNLAVELGQGHKVIVGVDSGSLWHTNTILEDIWKHFGFGSADHAVIVSGINTQDPEHPTVIVTDPGTGDVAKEYPIKDFLEAWRGSHFSFVSTADPAPPSLPEMAHFDYAQGHISGIGSAPYEFAAQLAREAAHEADPLVLARVDDAFLSFVHGHASLDPYTVPGLSHTDFSHAASDLVSAAHSGDAEPTHAAFSSGLHDSDAATGHVAFHDHHGQGFDPIGGTGVEPSPIHHEGHHEAWGDHGSGGDVDPSAFTGGDEHHE